MAAPFKVEDGTGFSDANSYTSVLTFREYYEISPENEIVLTWTDRAIENYMRRASRMIDDIVYPPSVKAHAGQAMQYPRAELTDSCTGIIYKNNEVPQKVVTATILIGFYLSQNDTLTGSAGQSTEEDNNIKRVKVDVIEVEFDLRKRESELSSAGIPVGAARLLACVGDLGSISDWVVRPRRLLDKNIL